MFYIGLVILCVIIALSVIDILFVILKLTLT